MKPDKISIMTVIAMCLFTSTAIFANSSGIFTVTDSIRHRFDIRVNSDRLVVLRADLLKGQSSLSFDFVVYSPDGKIMFRESFIRQKGVYRGYDLKNFKSGVYYFILIQNNQTIYSKIVLKTFDNVKVFEKIPLISDKRQLLYKR